MSCTWSCHVSLTLNLHVTGQLHLSLLHRPRYELFFKSSYCYYNLISLVLTRPPISTSSFWSRSSMRRMWAKQAVCFDLWLTRKDYLQINAFLDLVVMKQEECPHALQRKATRGVTSKVVSETAGRTQPSLTLGTSILASTIHHTTWWVGVTAE